MQWAGKFIRTIEENKTNDERHDLNCYGCNKSFQDGEISYFDEYQYLYEDESLGDIYIDVLCQVCHDNPQ